jgi:hypothetical protein
MASTLLVNPRRLQFVDHHALQARVESHLWLL